MAPHMPFRIPSSVQVPSAAAAIKRYVATRGDDPLAFNPEAAAAVAARDADSDVQNVTDRAYKVGVVYGVRVEVRVRLGRGGGDMGREVEREGGREGVREGSREGKREQQGRGQVSLALFREDRVQALTLMINENILSGSGSIPQGRFSPPCSPSSPQLAAFAVPSPHRLGVS